jgi:hypothetical protein
MWRIKHFLSKIWNRPSPDSEKPENSGNAPERSGENSKILKSQDPNISSNEPNRLSPWWVEISTAQPSCVYYFGPFESAEEAQIYQPGYIEDLQAEEAEGITVAIKQCQPQILTQEY